MIRRKRGKIVNICSVASELARPTIAPYTASKGAVKMLTKAMCADWAKHGLQINGIGPGYFKTELNRALVADPEFSSWVEKRTPARRWGDLDELIGAAIFLASDASSFVNGHILYVDGGISRGFLRSAHLPQRASEIGGEGDRLLLFSSLQSVLP